MEQILFKLKIKLISYLILVIIFSFSLFDKLMGQDRINITGGFGFPEVLNGGLRFRINQAMIGISIGSIPVDESFITISGDIYYHFSGSSKLSDMRPWYGKIGLTNLRDETEFSIDKYLYLNIRLGRDFNLSKKFGINIEAGFGLQLSYNEIIKKQSSDWINFDIEIPVIPSFGICLFYRI